LAYRTQSASCASGALTKRHAVINDGTTAYCYDANGNMLSGSARSYVWDAENRPTSITFAGVSETYTYDADGERLKVVRGSTTTVYVAGLWEEVIGGAVKSYYTLNGTVMALRDSGTNAVTYLHGDHLGSISLATTASGQGTPQYFGPWGARRAGGIGQTNRNYTGQYLDGTGLLYYHARYYDPTLARFLSADSVVPGSASGSMDGVALKGLTVDFHEPGFAARLGGENGQPFWFQMSDKQRQQAGSPWGPVNPQALNRYSYVLNGPVRWTDPTGHVVCTKNPSACRSPLEEWFDENIRKPLAKAAQEAWNNFWSSVGEAALNAGVAVSYTGVDGVERTIQSRVKENLALRKQAANLGEQASGEANDLLRKFLNGQTSPGLGNKRLPGTDIFYLRGDNGARVFMRQVSKDSYEILAYADKNNENRVISLLYEYYGR